MIEQKDLLQVQLIERQMLTLNGVINVEAFDDNKVLLKTTLGLLTIKGESLNITTLNLDDGQVGIQGMINGLEYSEDKGAKMRTKGKAMLSKFIR